MTPQWIEVDDEVIGAIKDAAEPFVDTPNDALRKLLRLGPASDPVARPFARRRSGWGSPRPLEGEWLQQSEYELPVLRALSQLGGRAPRWQVVKAVMPMLADRFGEADHGRLANGEERWKNKVGFARLKAVERGYMCSDSPRGIWELTEGGIERLSQLEAEQEEARSK